MNGPWIERVEIGDAQLYLGDSRAIAPALAVASADIAGATFDAVISDPPYGQNLKANVNTAQRKGKRYPDRIAGDDAPFDPAWICELAPAALIWGAHQFARRLPEDGRWLVWDKRAGKAPSINQADGEIAWANRAPQGRGGLRIFRLMWNGLCVDAAGKEDIGPGRPRVHPTQKPVALMRWCLAQLDLEPGAHVVDPYMGAGSTGLACLDAGMRFTGMEIEPQYFEVAVKRLREAVAAPKLFVSPMRERVVREDAADLFAAAEAAPASAPARYWPDSWRAREALQRAA